MDIHFIFIMNGIYDIVCAFSIISGVPYIERIHLSMFKDPNLDPIFKRVFGFWIFTYGIMRLSNNNTIITISYMIESLFFLNELLHKTVYRDKTVFVVVLSMIFAIAAVVS